MDVSMIREIASSLASEHTEMRHYLHTRPETAWKEVETSKYIEERLRALGLDNIRRGFGGTESGVVGDLIGDPSGPCVALRADIDGLPITEQNDVPYRSVNDGAMHACGHDGHMSILLGTVKLLSMLKDKLPGRVRFIFQPAEESGFDSGAVKMIAGGVLEGVGAIGGMHLWSFVPTGIVHWKNGSVMASVDSWQVEFSGRGGHGAMPHEAVDPTTAAASFIGALQTIVSREVDPVDTVVVSLGKLTSGDAFNIIPNSAYMLGTGRTFNPVVRSSLEERISRLARGIADAFRCKAETKYAYMYPSVINHPGVTALLAETATAVVGAQNVGESPLIMVSEDYSYYLEKTPGTFFFVGCGSKEKETDYPHHSPRFNIDDDVLPIAMTIFSSFAFRALDKLKAGGFAR
jgi:amidohydrolase